MKVLQSKILDRYLHRDNSDIENVWTKEYSFFRLTVSEIDSTYQVYVDQGDNHIYMGSFSDLSNLIRFVNSLNPLSDADLY